MKKFVTIFLSLILFATPVYAVTPTTVKSGPTTEPTAESATQKLSDKINSLKEKIASRVAELNLVEKKGIIGVIKEVKTNLISVTDIKGDTRLIDVDEITKFSDGSDNIGISDLKAGEKIAIVGLYNKDSEHLLARFISKMNLPIVTSGAISGIDDKTFTLTLIKENGDQIKIDVENVTKTTLYSGTTGEKSGFSSVKRGNRVIIIGFPDAKEKDRIVATRLLLFPTLPKNPRLVMPDNAIDTSNGPVTSSGSGNKLTPLR